MPPARSPRSTSREALRRRAPRRRSTPRCPQTSPSSPPRARLPASTRASRPPRAPIATSCSTGRRARRSRLGGRSGGPGRSTRRHSPAAPPSSPDEHDFTAFTPAVTEHDVFVRKIRAAAWERDGDHLHFTITADSFLRHMVRTLVGTMLESTPERLALAALLRGATAPADAERVTRAAVAAAPGGSLTLGACQSDPRSAGRGSGFGREVGSRTARSRDRAATGPRARRVVTATARLRSPHALPVVLFDLDGTLIDSGPIIMASMRHASVTVLGREPDEEKVRAAIGGPGLVGADARARPGARRRARRDLPRPQRAAARHARGVRRHARAAAPAARAWSPARHRHRQAPAHRRSRPRPLPDPARDDRRRRRRRGHGATQARSRPAARGARPSRGRAATTPPTSATPPSTSAPARRRACSPSPSAGAASTRTSGSSHEQPDALVHTPEELLALL